MQVEDIIRERAEQSIPGDEAAFFDPADDLNEVVLDEELPAAAEATASNTSGAGGAEQVVADVPLVSELMVTSHRDKTLPYRGIHVLGITLTEW